MNTVRTALVSALQRGGTSISREDLSEGVQRYCVRQPLVDRNPFADAVQSAGARRSRSDERDDEAVLDGAGSVETYDDGKGDDD